MFEENELKAISEKAELERVKGNSKVWMKIWTSADHVRSVQDDLRDTREMLDELPSQPLTREDRKELNFLRALELEQASELSEAEEELRALIVNYEPAQKWLRKHLDKQYAARLHKLN